jgi:uroporphyrinogen decarboxylase
MTGRERFIDVFEYRSVDRVPNWEAGVWGQTRERWDAEGLADENLHWNWWDGEDYFGMDHRLFVPVDFGMTRPFEHRVIEETDDYEIFVTEAGVTRKALKHGRSKHGTRASMDQFLDFPVKTREDFAEMRKRYELALEKRYPQDWRAAALPEWKSATIPTILGRNTATAGFYWRARGWMGTESLCYAWYDEPKLMHEMMEFIADLTIEVATPVLEEMDFDYVMLAEDMAMKSGPLLSPDTFREFIFPHLKRLIEFFKGRGVRYVMVDTDGNSEPLLPLLLDAGVDAIWPIERASCDMDPAFLREKYGRSLRLFGAVDKRELAKGKKAIDDHLASLLPLIEEGGFIPTVDHTVPPDVSLENFRHYMDRKAELLQGR